MVLDERVERIFRRVLEEKKTEKASSKDKSKQKKLSEEIKELKKSLRKTPNGANITPTAKKVLEEKIKSHEETLDSIKKLRESRKEYNRHAKKLWEKYFVECDVRVEDLSPLSKKEMVLSKVEKRIKEELPKLKKVHSHYKKR